MAITDEQRRRTAAEKLAELKAGKSAITNDAEMNVMLTLGDDAIYSVRSIPNPQRVGILDQYLVWIGGPTPPTA